MLFVILVIIFVLVVATLIFNRNGLMALSALREDIGQVTTAIDSLEDQILRLEEEIRLLSSDSAYQERMVREILGWGREGEFVVRFLSADSSDILP